jgi:hypothetical protein
MDSGQGSSSAKCNVQNLLQTRQSRSLTGDTPVPPADITSGIGTVTATIVSTQVSDGEIIDLSGLTAGPHTFTVNAADKAGNMASVSRTFTVQPVPAVVTIDPGTLNMKSQGDKNAGTVTIELAGADVNAIDVSSVTITYAGKTITALASLISTGDTNGNGIPDRMVKFNRQDLIRIVVPGESLTLTVSGRAGGDAFEGSSTIRVISTANGNCLGKTK